jgi:hypothetical protein
MIADEGRLSSLTHQHHSHHYHFIGSVEIVLPSSPRLQAPATRTRRNDALFIIIAAAAFLLHRQQRVFSTKDGDVSSSPRAAAALLDHFVQWRE